MENPDAARAMEELGNLKGSEAHSTIILTDEDKNVLRKLGINVTFDPTTNTTACIVIKLNLSLSWRGFLSISRASLYDIMKEEN